MRLITINENESTMEECLKDFFNFKEAQHLSPKTMRDYRLYLGDFLSKSHNSMDDKILTQDALNYLASIPDTSPARFNHPYSCMSAFFNWAVKLDIIRRNPLTAQGIKKKRDEGNIKPANLDDVKVLLNSWDIKTFTGFRNYSIILVMLDTGIRTSELVQLLDSDFDPVANQLTVRKTISKTRKMRIVYLSTQTATVLKKFLRCKPKEWVFMFPTREGQQLRTEGLDLEFNRQCKRVGVKFTPYQLRHTFASYFVANGGDLFTLQDLMGHSDLRMTRRYTELDDVNKRQQHDANSPINALSRKTRIVNI